ncbi:MAG: hypothetical protein ABR922_23520, partial [Streptosporangiaceae bacterium]
MVTRLPAGLARLTRHGRTAPCVTGAGFPQQLRKTGADHEVRLRERVTSTAMTAISPIQSQ